MRMFGNLIKASTLALVLAPFVGQAEAGEKLKVVTTFTVLADMAANVAGDAAEVVSITKPGAEIHGYEPTPRDIVRAYDADLILWHGMNLELWFEQFLLVVLNRSMGHVRYRIAIGSIFCQYRPYVL